MKVTIPAGAESVWLIFDWSYTNDAGNWLNQCKVAIDGATKKAIAANSSTDKKWASLALQVTGDAGSEHTVTWDAVDPNSTSAKVGIDNVRTAQGQTSVSASDDGHATTTVQVSGSDVAAVDPGTSVTFTAVPAEGYVFEGWKTSQNDAAYLSTDNPYTMTVWDSAVALYACTSKPFAGAGTEASPFELASVQDFKTLNSYLANGDTFSGTYFKLMSDVDLASSDFTGFTSRFDGSLDGAGHTVSGLAGDTKGLFSQLGEAAKVANLTVEASVSSTQQYTGIVAGRSSGTISNVTVKGSVSSSAQYVGGIVGDAGSNGTIENCTVLASVTGSYADNMRSSIGGVAGQSSLYSTIKNCYVGASVTGTPATDGANVSGVGGIVGYVSSVTTIDGCLVKTDISASKHVGGVVGYATGIAVVTGCRYDGNIVATGEGAGGMVGYGNANNAQMKVDSNMATGTVAADSCAGGIVGYTTKAATYSNNIALQSSITASQNAGRVAGQNENATWGGASTLSNNYVYDEMTVNGVAVADADKGADAIQGADRTRASLYDTTVPAPYDTWTTGWAVTAGVCPVITGIDSSLQGGYPAYLAPDPVLDDIASATITVKQNLSYTGAAIDPIASVTLAGAALPASAYTVSYLGQDGKPVDAAVNAGTYTVVLTGNGTTHTGSCQAEFAIAKSGAMAVSADNVEATYDGKGHGVSATANADDATIRYYNEKSGAYDLTASPEFVNAGTYTVKFKATSDNYEDAEGSATVTIGKADAMMLNWSANSGLYDGTEHGLFNIMAYVSGQHYDNVEVLYYNDATGAYDLSESPVIVNVGELTIKAKVVDKAGNYVDAEVEQTVRVSPADLSKAEVTGVGDRVYTGEAIELAPQLKLGDLSLEDGKDYAYSCLDASGATVDSPTAVGTYTLSVKGTGNFTGEARVSFGIVPPSIVDGKTGVSVEGTVLVDALEDGQTVELQTREIASDEDRYAELKSGYATEDCDVFKAYDVQLAVKDASGALVRYLTEDLGDLKVTFPVGADYNGRSVTVVAVHVGADGAEEAVSAKTAVADGAVSVTVDRLSDFALSIGAAEQTGGNNGSGASVNTDTPPAQTSTAQNVNTDANAGAAGTPANTGDGHGLLVAVSAACAAGAALALSRRKMPRACGNAQEDGETR